MSVHLLSIDDLNRDALEHLFSVAERLELVARRRKVTRILEGAVLGNLFFEASTRTRISFHTAFSRLGGAVCDTTGFTFSSMAKGESLGDTARVMAGYADAIVMRHPERGSVAEFAEGLHIPVINAGDGPGEHPSQALLDLYTLRKEFALRNKPLAGAHVLMTGDLKYGRTVHSLAKLLSIHAPMRFTLVAPPMLKMPLHLIDLLENRGHQVTVVNSLHEVTAPVDMIYATRIQKERFTEEAHDVFAGIPDAFLVNQQRVNAIGAPDAIIMHPLPRDSRPDANDLSVDLNGDPRLTIFRQADNGIPIRMAIFATLLGVDPLIEASLRDVTWRVPQTLSDLDVPLTR